MKGASGLNFLRAISLKWTLEVKRIKFKSEVQFCFSFLEDPVVIFHQTSHLTEQG